ncbi:MAG: thioredoxin domain-containing protein [Desulfobacteraceae bacterium]|nr:thioredoxin domain-containing protein [Desulfobacteraceae bacterium]
MKSNNLINEKSPYLIQHVNNPVDWHPWSKNAFKKAKDENKPVFVSIGYAACHWCHVMEKESFEDEETAGYLNETFVCIKVDREERPDIDAVYMAACQMLIGSGGWPLSVFMTPDKKPFFAATYIPKQSQFGRVGMIDLCKQIKKTWTLRNEKILDAAETITSHLDRAFTFSPGENPDESVLSNAYNLIEKSFDSKHGGFESAPKFPSPHRLLFLLQYYRRTGISAALDMVCKTLTAMRIGGIWDHVGFGFHRYSTDKYWLVPHFEKMLYDQAMLALAYLETWHITKDDFYAKTAEEIFTYVLRDMTSEQGGFFAAEDADSEDREGKFYVWTFDEFIRTLEKNSLAEKGLPWEDIFNMRGEGNFSEEVSGRKTRENILHLRSALPEWADKLNMDKAELSLQWEKVREVLFRSREQRIQPMKDDKVLTDWNGLMIAALARGAGMLDKPEYAQAAQKAVQFILANMRDNEGGLLHRFRDGEAAFKAGANDYAFFIMGLLELNKTCSDPAYLEQAVILQNRMTEEYWNHDKGGFFLTPASGNGLPVRPVDLYDGAIPSANSVSLSNLLRLAKLTGDKKWEQKAGLLVRTFAGSVQSYPPGYTYFLLGIIKCIDKKD